MIESFVYIKILQCKINTKTDDAIGTSEGVAHAWRLGCNLVIVVVERLEVSRIELHLLADVPRRPAVTRTGAR